MCLRRIGWAMFASVAVRRLENRNWLSKMIYFSFENGAHFETDQDAMSVEINSVVLGNLNPLTLSIFVWLYRRHFDFGNVWFGLSFMAVRYYYNTWNAGFHYWWKSYCVIPPLQCCTWNIRCWDDCTVLLIWFAIGLGFAKSMVSGLCLQY